MRIQYKCLVQIYVFPHRNETARPRYFQNIIIMFCLPITTFIYPLGTYIFPGSICLFCCSQIGRPILWLINRSHIHECRNWEWGRAVSSFLGIHKSDFHFRYCVEWLLANTVYSTLHEVLYNFATIYSTVFVHHWHLFFYYYLILEVSIWVLHICVQRLDKKFYT